MEREEKLTFLLSGVQTLDLKACKTTEADTHSAHQHPEMAKVNWIGKQPSKYSRNVWGSWDMMPEEEEVINKMQAEVELLESGMKKTH